MPRTLISLGANLGNVRESMRAAKRLLIDSFGESNSLFSQQLFAIAARGTPVYITRGKMVGLGDSLTG